MQTTEHIFSNLHGHTDKDSNLRFLDATITVHEMLDYAHQLGYGAVSLTGHESLSSHIEAERYYHANRDKFGDMKLILGNEIYLVDEQELKKAEDENVRFRFNHFLLNALDKKGHEFIQKLSSIAWSRLHTFRGAERVPTYYTDIEQLMISGGYKGHVIASTACLAGRMSQDILNNEQEPNTRYVDDIKEFSQWLINTFGKGNVYFELMPSHHEEQLLVNDKLKQFSSYFDIPYIITLDSHYMNEMQRPVHDALLHSRDSNRDLTAYDTARMMDINEIKTFFDEDTLNIALSNINSIVNRVEDYSFEHTPIVPKSHIPDFENVAISDNSKKKYPNIDYYVNSKFIEDKYLIKLAIDGFKKLALPFNDNYLGRLDIELRELKAISIKIGQPMSSYFLAEHEFIDLIWDISLVGSGRGSAACWLLNYVLGLTQVDAVKYNLPYYRFLSKERISENKASQYPDKQ